MLPSFALERRIIELVCFYIYRTHFSIQHASTSSSAKTFRTFSVRIFFWTPLFQIVSNHQPSDHQPSLLIAAKYEYVCLETAVTILAFQRYSGTN